MNQLRIICIFLLLGCSSYPKLQTVANLDLDKYQGRWYEITSIPVFAQKGCRCTTATYGIKEDGNVSVYNRCLKENNEISDIEGYAEVVQGSNNARLNVVFFWPFKGDYQVIGLSDDYKIALVGNQSRKYLWLLSRTPKLNDETIEAYLNMARAQGYELNELQVTNHNNCNYDLKT
jgi:apolipoprotein D and lipocalin family protein